MLLSQFLFILQYNFFQSTNKSSIWFNWWANILGTKYEDNFSKGFHTYKRNFEVESQIEMHTQMYMKLQVHYDMV